MVELQSVGKIQLIHLGSPTYVIVLALKYGICVFIAF